MLPVSLLIAFLVVPILEIYVILQVGHLIGGWPTVALLIIESLVGAWIVRREGRRAWRALTSTFQKGGLPDRELADAALVLVGGVLLLTPGFVTDVFGFLFVLPFTRPAVRWALSAYVGRRVRVAQSRAAASFEGFGGTPRPRDGSGPQEGSAAGAGGPGVVRGEVIEEDRDPR
ncbi:FxsA family protein [Actinomadura sp. DC4]|uniref:FxsA family protein n=1 Tax=Actinomadura sp. DC4 TaxID=3055069 RepID=UPI0025B1263A|nr:FxsA family protein [Actinomadura sp. DC4]MDN3356304.1 FxsA family protein [Actinomadura sp. DC4]